MAEEDLFGFQNFSGVHPGGSPGGQERGRAGCQHQDRGRDRKRGGVGRFDAVEKRRREASERRGSDDAGQHSSCHRDKRPARHRAGHLRATRAQRKAHADLPPPPRHTIGERAGRSDDDEHDCQTAERREQRTAQTLWHQQFSDAVVERSDFGHRKCWIDLLLNNQQELGACLLAAGGSKSNASEGDRFRKSLTVKELRPAHDPGAL